MSKEENRIIRRRLRNAYMSSIISISLVLLLTGVASLLVVNVRRVSDYFKEHMQLTVLLNQEVGEKSAQQYLERVETFPCVKRARLVSREEGTRELEALLGRDFLEVFGSSPVPLSVEIGLKADYVSKDSLEVVQRLLAASPLVDEVNCQQSLVEALNANLTKISLVLGVLIALLLFISCVLIGNTVRLSVFAQRFTIHTMKLVGATRGFILRPFLGKAVLQGLLSALAATGLLAGALVAVRKGFGPLYEVFDPASMLSVSLIVAVGGVLICVVSTWFVVGRLLARRKDDLYF
ncbi:MAG: permease-like cell division protein FtsX [Bacteroidales bacterium]|nr:permease-like cell division protein FtsX [Bacteroidales bacterium]